MKRCFDLVVAGLLLLLMLPVVLVLLAISAVVFRASPVFVQPRLGRGGELFTFVKIRSLPATTPTTMDKFQLDSVDVPRWGRFIRRTHLDELPQLALVVAGKMSLVGPRPEMPELAATFDSAFVSQRCEVLPGITGLWQVGHGLKGLIGETPEYDRFYLEHRSGALDAWILWRTAIKILPGDHLIGIADVPAWCLGTSRPVDRSSELISLEGEGASSGS